MKSLATNFLLNTGDIYSYEAQQVRMTTTRVIKFAFPRRMLDVWMSTQS